MDMDMDLGEERAIFQEFFTKLSPEDDQIVRVRIALKQPDAVVKREDALLIYPDRLTLETIQYIYKGMFVLWNQRMSDEQRIETRDCVEELQPSAIIDGMVQLRLVDYGILRTVMTRNCKGKPLSQGRRIPLSKEKPLGKEKPLSKEKQEKQGKGRKRKEQEDEEDSKEYWLTAEGKSRIEDYIRRLDDQIEAKRTELRQLGGRFQKDFAPRQQQQQVTREYDYRKEYGLTRVESSTYNELLETLEKPYKEEYRIQEKEQMKAELNAIFSNLQKLYAFEPKLNDDQKKAVFSKLRKVLKQEGRDVMSKLLNDIVYAIDEHRAAQKIKILTTKKSKKAIQEEEKAKDKAIRKAKANVREMLSNLIDYVPSEVIDSDMEEESEDTVSSEDIDDEEEEVKKKVKATPRRNIPMLRDESLFVIETPIVIETPTPPQLYRETLQERKKLKEEDDRLEKGDDRLVEEDDRLVEEDDRLEEEETPQSYIIEDVVDSGRPSPQKKRAVVTSEAEQNQIWVDLFKQKVQSKKENWEIFKYLSQDIKEKGQEAYNQVLEDLEWE